MVTDDILNVLKLARLLSFLSGFKCGIYFGADDIIFIDHRSVKFFFVKINIYHTSVCSAFSERLFFFKIRNFNEPIPTYIRYGHYGLCKNYKSRYCK